LLDAGADQIVKSVFVPSEERKVGEVRLIMRGQANIVQTLLYTKVLSRVVGEIRKKEMANWPPEQAGHADAVRYVDALSDVQKTLWNRMPEHKRIHDRRQLMLIEFVIGQRDGLVVIGAFDMNQSAGETRVTRREPMVTLTPSRAYLVRNMRLIAADSFKVEGAALDVLLAPLTLLSSPPRGGDEDGVQP
jgi:hypothetical protein